jgi:hypothetical protein
MSLWIASALLATGAVLYLAIARAYPMVQRATT